MRHYFTEKHKTPMSWFAMRLEYTRSVATTSVVGHILGLGDRHTSNILIDNGTGQVVHIDLGIAFDQVSKKKTQGTAVVLRAYLTRSF
jgi:serine-protein kinase ATM